MFDKIVEIFVEFGGEGHLFFGGFLVGEKCVDLLGVGRLDRGRVELEDFGKKFEFLVADEEVDHPSKQRVAAERFLALGAGVGHGVREAVLGVFGQGFALVHRARGIKFLKFFYFSARKLQENLALFREECHASVRTGIARIFLGFRKKCEENLREIWMKIRGRKFLRKILEKTAGVFRPKKLEDFVGENSGKK